MIRIDLEAGWVEIDAGSGVQRFPLASAEAFTILSRAWLRGGWDTKYVYSFTWMGRPIIQLPEDMIRIQEIVYRVKPDVLIESGIAHGGSLVFYASLFKAMGRGRVIGIDLELRPHNRSAIERHELFPLIELVEGDSIDPDIVARVKSMVRSSERVLVVLDSRHTRAHVLAELRSYARLVSPGSYIVATDGIMGDLVGAPRSAADWGWNNPKEAAAEFVRESTEFVLEEPLFPFNEGLVRERVTYWPGAFLRRH
jgi:cephalosporin hydroxylase